MNNKKQPDIEGAGELVEEINETDALVDQLNNKYLRALADYQNLEKRMHTAVDQARATSQRITLSRFMNVLDDMEKAEVFTKDQGLQMIMNHFKQIFKDAGVEELDLLNKEFDPYTAEAIEAVAGDKDNIVAEVVRKGYRIGDDIIRPAQVKVTKKSTG